MRKFLILVLAGLLGFVSCSKDKDETPSNPLAGTAWFYEVNDGEDLAQIVITFKVDGTYVVTDDGIFGSTGTYSVDGDRISVTENGVTDEGTFILEGDELRLFFDSGFALILQRYQER